MALSPLCNSRLIFSVTAFCNLEPQRTVDKGKKQNYNQPLCRWQLFFSFQGKNKITINLCVDGFWGGCCVLQSVDAKNNNQPLHRRLWARCATVDWFFPWLRFAIQNRSAIYKGENYNQPLCRRQLFFSFWGGCRFAIDNEKKSTCVSMPELGFF